MKLKTVLLRLGSEKLIKLIDDDFFKILKLRNKILINQQNLSNIILQVNSEKKLITEAKTRELLIDALKENEANLIGKLFNLNNKNIWKSLKKVNFKKKKNLDLLLDIFEIEKNEKKLTLETQEVKQNPLTIQPKYALFSHQIDVLNKVTDLFKKPVKKVLLHMPTGAGKTRTAINLTSNHLKESSKSLIVWLAHTEELCQQAHDEFNKAWEIIGNRKIQSFKLFKDFRYDLEKINSGFVVMSLDYAYSLTQRDQKKFLDLARRTDFVIMDEAHMSIARSYKQVLEILVNRKTKLLGLTATPGRAKIISEENEKLASFFHKQKATLEVKGYKNPVLYLQDKGYLAKIKNEKLETTIDISKIFSKAEIKSELARIQSGQDLSKSFIKKLSSNEKRTNMIIEKAISENKNSNNKIIIFAGSIDSARHIFKILKMENLECALVTGETNLTERRNNIELFKDSKSGLNIIINYGVLTTGFDAPKSNVAIIGRPTQSVTLYSQMIGRVMRGVKSGGNKNCKVITVKDPIYGFRDMSESFEYWEELWN
jgi:DNA repair protein RadD